MRLVCTLLNDYGDNGSGQAKDDVIVSNGQDQDCLPWAALGLQAPFHYIELNSRSGASRMSGRSEMWTILIF